MYLASSYLAQLQALLPTGAAWTREPEAMLTRVLAAEAEEYARLDERIDQFEDETDPRTTYELIADWERVLGLPDPCTAAATSLQARQAACWRKLAYQAGQTPAFYIALAASIGFEIEIHEFDPDVDDYDGSLTGLLGGGRYRYVWRVAVLNAGTFNFLRAGDPCGERLAEGEVAIDVECILQAAKPAHTHIVFSYPEDGLPVPAGPPEVEDVEDVAVAAGTATDIDLSSHISGGHTSVSASAGAHGTTHVAGDVVTYTPEEGYTGADSFTYTATGPGGTSAPATVTVDVAAPEPPEIEDVSGIAVAIDTAMPIDLSGHIGGAHTSIATGAAAHGAVVVSGDVVTYTPASGYSGPDSFTWTATGPGGTSDTKTVSLVVGALLHAENFVAEVRWREVNSIDLSGAISGTFTSITVGPASHGTVFVSGNIANYTVGSYLGGDSFTYTAHGPGGATSTATVSLFVNYE